MNGKMKILTLTSSFPKDAEDISGRFVRDLAQELHKRGNDVLILAPHSPGLSLVETSGDLRVHRFRYWFPSKHEVLTNGAILPKLSGNLLATVQIPFLVAASFISSLRLTKSMDTQVIHTHWLLPQGLVGALVSKMSGKPHLATIHAGGLVALKRMPFKKSIAKFIVKNSDAISAVSQYIKNNFLDILDPETRSEALAKMNVVPMGVDPKRFENEDGSRKRASLGLKSDDYVVLFVGRLSEKKGIEDLLVAFQSFSREEERARLWIVGSGPLYESLKQRASEGIDVRFFGRVPDKQLNELFLAADVVVVPSVTTSYGDVEGLPVVVMEAMTAGKPIIATDVGGISDAIEDERTGLLIPERSPEIIENGLRRFREDREFRESVARNAAEKARTQYSWSVISEKFDRIMKEIVQGQRI
ncbi:MAG: glycosyltransferase family 4 protein [Methanomassiliicoccales archaeon]|nr:MAG: glycosyltransferase family 4 protein [Methanomassiliicoccales archaeon]